MMDEREQDVADRIYRSIQAFTKNSERSQQSKEFRAGISDLGYCSERTRRMLAQQVPEDTDMLKAFIGTALGDHVEQAIEKHFDSPVIRQAEVVLNLEVGSRSFQVPGHPDLVFPDLGLVLDAKSSDGLSLARRLGADQQKNFQRHGYGIAAWEAGLLGDLPLEKLLVGNVWIDRSGDEQEVHVEIVPFDHEVIAEASRWLDEVIYNYIHETEAEKEPAREVCAVTCGFYRECRAFDTDAIGLLTDETVLEAVKMHLEGTELARQAKRLKDDAKPALKDISGSTGTHTVRWVHVNESTVPESTRRAYSRLDVKPLTTNKVKKGKA